MKKVLCAHDCGRFKAGSIYKAEETYQNDEHREMVVAAGEFLREFRDSGCSCHINPPCSHCMHPGNPINLESCGYDEDGDPLEPKRDSECLTDSDKAIQESPSPQELAFAAKQSKPEKPKLLTFPDVKLTENFSYHVGGKWG